MQTLRWKKPLTADDQQEIRRVIAERKPLGEAFACINTKNEIRLVFPVLQEVTESLKQ